MAKGIGYNGIVPGSSDLSDRIRSSGSGSYDDWQDEFYDVGHTIKESISKISVLSRDREMFYRIEKDYKAFAKGIQSALNEGSYFRQGQKNIDPVTGMSAIDYYVQTSEIKNAMEALRSVQGKLYGTDYQIRPPEQMDYITGTRTFEGRQAQAKAQYEIGRRGGKLLASPTLENPDLYTYMLPFSDNWTRGTALDDYLNSIFTDSDTLSRFEHSKRASEAEVDRNYAMAKKAEMMKKLSASQASEASSIWNEFESEENAKRNRDIEVNYQATVRTQQANARRDAEIKKEEEKKKREEERQKMAEATASRAKNTFLIGQVVSMFTILLDLTRRILSNGLAMASQAKQTETEARNIGSSYGAMLQYNYADRAYGLKEGTTATALFGLQKMFGDTANIDTKALGKLAMIMGSDVGDMVRSGLGGKNPEALLGMIMNAFFKAQQEGRNQFGQNVGQEEARRNLYTLLSEVSPEIATLFARMVEANTTGINKGRIGSWQDYLDINRRAMGNLSDTDLKSFTALGEVIDELKAKIGNFANMFTQSFLLNLSGFIDRINNLKWGMSGAEAIDEKSRIIERLGSRKAEISASQAEREAVLMSALSGYGVSGSFEQILKDLNESPDFWQTAGYSAETINRIRKNRRAVALMYADNPIAKGMMIQYALYEKALGDIGNQLANKDNPVYNEYGFSDEGIISGQKFYTGALLNPEWTEGYFEGISLTDFWERAVIDDSYTGNVSELSRLLSIKNPMHIAKLYNAYDAYVNRFASKKGTRDARDFSNALSVLYTRYQKSGGKDSLDKFSADETNKMLAFILLMSGELKRAGKTASALYGESSMLGGMYESDLTTISNLGNQFIAEQGSNAVGALQNTSFTVTPVGGGMFTIKFVADVNGKTIEKEYKDVPLQGRYESGIEYDSDSLQERTNRGFEQANE